VIHRGTATRPSFVGVDLCVDPGAANPDASSNNRVRKRNARLAGSGRHADLPLQTDLVQGDGAISIVAKLSRLSAFRFPLSAFRFPLVSLSAY
jgi:hypothetical protein